MIESASDISNKEFNFNTRILQNDQNEAHEFLSQEFFLFQTVGHPLCPDQTRVSQINYKNCFFKGPKTKVNFVPKDAKK